MYRNKPTSYIKTMKRDEFVYVAFVVCLIALIFYLADEKVSRMDKHCMQACLPNGFHVKSNSVELKCACEEKFPGVIRFKDAGKSN